MEIKAYLSIGLVGCDREEIIDVPDSELEGLDDEQRQEVIDEYLKDWIWGHIEYGYKD